MGVNVIEGWGGWVDWLVGWLIGWVDWLVGWLQSVGLDGGPFLEDLKELPPPDPDHHLVRSGVIL